MTRAAEPRWRMMQAMHRDDLPSGTVTFLFTDIEASTLLLDELGPEAYRAELDAHRRVVREACMGAGGVEVDTQGDAFFVAFPTAAGAIEAAQAITQSLTNAPISVRIGVHTGTPLVTDEGYVGADVHRAARIAAAGHGGQVLVSASTAALVGVELNDLGEHRFKDLARPERVYQLGDAEHPPLRSLRNVRLPVPATPFLGRYSELDQVAGLLAEDNVRLLTLTGPGGTGKTRLALQAAAESSGHHSDGVWWVPLAPLRDPELLTSVIAQALGINERPDHRLEDDVAARLRNNVTLVVLDNVEHLLPAAADVVANLVATTDATWLVTSRERLQIQAEQVFPVPTLSEHDGVALFLARARALEPSFESNGSVMQLCTRLDNLPLALELAAARTVLFSPEQLLERLSQRLDLLKGPRDADPRQQTLRAAVEWSYELLTSAEQRLFRSLSCFANGCTYEASEEVCDADPESLQSLLDKSLLRRRDSRFGPRYWMLETIREYGADRLEQADEAEGVRHRHAAWCCSFLERRLSLVGQYPPDTDTVDDFERVGDEHDNIQAALAWAFRRGEDELALRLGTRCFRFWARRGMYRNVKAWLVAADARLGAASPLIQLQALKVAGLIAFFFDTDSGAADNYWVRAIAVAEELGEPREIAWLESRRAGVIWERGELEQALILREAALSAARAAGDIMAEADELHMIGEVLRDLRRFEEAEKALLGADRMTRELNHDFLRAANAHSLGDLEVDRGDPAAALPWYRQSLSIATRQGILKNQLMCLAGIAAAYTDLGRDEEAAKLWGAACGIGEDQLGYLMLSPERKRYESRLGRLEGTDAWSAGRSLSLEQALELLTN
jgi:predicted ATPase/class 3 adenylate cyclase